MHVGVERGAQGPFEMWLLRRIAGLSAESANLSRLNRAKRAHFSCGAGKTNTCSPRVRNRGCGS